MWPLALFSEIVTPVFVFELQMTNAGVRRSLATRVFFLAWKWSGFRNPYSDFWFLMYFNHVFY